MRRQPQWRPLLVGAALLGSPALLVGPALLAGPALARDASPVAAQAGRAAQAAADDQNDDSEDDSQNTDDTDDSDDDDDADDNPLAPPTSWPTTYIDLETGWSSTPGGVIGFGLRKLRHLSGETSRGLYISAPLTIDITDSISIYAGIDGSASQTPGERWSKLSSGSWSVGGSATLNEQQGLLPSFTLSASVSRPLEPILGGVNTTSWTGGIDLDYALDKDETRGLTAGLSFSRTMVSASRAHIGAQYDGYIGGYWSPSAQLNVSAQIGVQYFAGAEISSALKLQLKPVTTPYVQLEIEHVDKDDTRLFAINLMLGWSPKPSVQLALSTPLYLAR